MGLVLTEICFHIYFYLQSLFLELQSTSNAKQRYNDGKIEILGISSSFQMAQLQVGLSKPYCLGQGSKVEVNTITISCKPSNNENSATNKLHSGDIYSLCQTTDTGIL